MKAHYGDESMLNQGSLPVEKQPGSKSLVELTTGKYQNGSSKSGQDILSQIIRRLKGPGVQSTHSKLRSNFAVFVRVSPLH